MHVSVVLYYVCVVYLCLCEYVCVWCVCDMCLCDKCGVYLHVVCGVYGSSCLCPVLFLTP